MVGDKLFLRYLHFFYLALLFAIYPWLLHTPFLGYISPCNFQPYPHCFNIDPHAFITIHYLRLFIATFIRNFRHLFSVFRFQIHLLDAGYLHPSPKCRT